MEGCLKKPGGKDDIKRFGLLHEDAYNVIII